MFISPFIKRNRIWITAALLAITGIFTFQNCTRTFFSMDYQSRVNSLDLSSEAPPVWINTGKNTNQSVVPVQLNLSKLEDGVQESVIKFRYSFDATNLNSKPWEDIKTSFTADMESLYANDGSKDGPKTLIVELQTTRNGIVRIEGSVILDTLAPQIILFDVAHGAETTTKNFTEAQIKVLDTKSPVSRICFKQKALSPDENDSCWQTLKSLGLESNTVINLKNVPYIIGFLRGTYVIYAYVEDEAGNISTVSLSKTIEYNPPIPPVVTDIFVANTNEMQIPPAASELKISGSAAFIKWKILTTAPIVEKAVKIYITTNEKDFTLVQDGLNNSANSGCTIDENSTGCAALNYSFPSGYFRLRVSVKDQNGQIAVGSSTPLNTDGFQVLAGNTDPGLEGSATAAIFFNYLTTNNFESDPQSFVITDKGQIIFRDYRRGLLIVEPNDGMIRVLMPLGQGLSEGSISAAKLNANRARIALDYSGKILIADDAALRRLDLEKNEITTLIGGGSSLENEVDAREFKFSSCTGGCPIYPLPNGDIFFTTAADFSSSFNGTARIRKYSAADGKIYSYKPTGVGTLQSPQLEVTNPEYTLDNFVIGFDPSNSQLNFIQLIIGKPVVGGRVFAHATLNPQTFVTLPSDEQVPNALKYMYTSDQYAVDKMGSAYAFSRIDGFVKKFNPTDKKWNVILGTGVQGSCADSALATACAVDLQSIFLGLQGYLFFADRGRIRVINDNTTYTMAGQAFNFGDQGYAISARFGSVEYLDIDQTGKIKILDPIENRIREFTRGSEIKSIAGDGSNQVQTNDSPALASPMYSSYWGGSASFVTDPTTGDIFISGNGSVFKLDRSSGKWTNVVGGGGLQITEGNGKPGNEINIQYPPLVLGYQNGKLLVATHQWKDGYNYGCLVNQFATTNNFVLKSVLGNNQPCQDDYPENGVTQNSLSLMSTFSNSHLIAEYIPEEKVWVGGSTYRKRLVNIKENADAVLTTRIQFPRNIFAFARTKNADSQEVYYYCATDTSRIYKYNAATKAETALSWPSDTINCAGFKVKYDSTTNSVIFPYRQNNLSGVAAISDTP